MRVSVRFGRWDIPSDMLNQTSSKPPQVGSLVTINIDPNDLEILTDTDLPRALN